MLGLIIPPWVKLAAVAVLLAAAALGGWQVRGWKEDAAKLDAERAAQATYRKTVEGWAAAMQEIDKQRAADRQQAAQDRNDWQRRLNDARREGRSLAVCGDGLQPDGVAGMGAGGGPVRFTADFVGLWDDGLAIGLPKALRAGSDHRTGGGADLPNAEDLIENVAANGEACNELRSRLLAAQAWARSIGAMK